MPSRGLGLGEDHVRHVVTLVLRDPAMWPSLDVPAHEDKLVILSGAAPLEACFHRSHLLLGYVLSSHPRESPAW